MKDYATCGGGKMVIRITKAMRFFFVCALLLVTALISIGTRSISVSAPYNAQPLPGRPLPIVVYHADTPTSPSPREVREDLDGLLSGGYAALSERDLVASLRRESALPARSVLLLFDDRAPAFGQLRPLLEESGLPWLPLDKAGLLTQELRAAGYAVVRVERVAGFTLVEQLG